MFYVGQLSEGWGWGEDGLGWDAFARSLAD